MIYQNPSSIRVLIDHMCREKVKNDTWYLRLKQITRFALITQPEEEWEECFSCLAKYNWDGIRPIIHVRSVDELRKLLPIVTSGFFALNIAKSRNPSLELSSAIELGLLRRVSDLCLVDSKLDSHEIKNLMSSPDISNLYRLKVYGYRPFEVDTIKSIADSRHLPNLKHLDLSGKHMGDQGVAHICRSSLASNLESLNIGSNEISDQGMIYLAQTKWTNIKKLNLEYNPFTEVGLKNLAQNKHDSKLRSLLISTNRNFGDGVLTHALQQGPFFTKIENLSLAQCELGAMDLKQIATGETFKNLARFTSSSNAFSESEFTAFARTDRARNLNSIKTEYEAVNSNAVSALMSKVPSCNESLVKLSVKCCRVKNLCSKLSPSITDLTLDSNKLGPDGVKSVACAIKDSSLESLSLVDVRMDANSVIVLLENLPKTLTKLNLNRNYIGDDLTAALSQWDGLNQLEHLGLESSLLSDNALVELIESDKLHKLTSIDLSGTQNFNADTLNMVKEACRNLQRIIVPIELAYG